MTDIVKNAALLAKSKYQRELCALNSGELHDVLSSAFMEDISDRWIKCREKRIKERTAYYFSAEFLVGRAIFNNLVSAGIYDEVENELRGYKVSLKQLEEVEDSALGNGGLGRLAACFLDSAATMNLPLDGYGIRYKFGLFKQDIVNGFQTETADDWTRQGDPWSLRCERDTVTVEFKDMSVNAVPYDMPVVGYKNSGISTLRLWQSEPVVPFDLEGFNS